MPLTSLRALNPGCRPLTGTGVLHNGFSSTGGFNPSANSQPVGTATNVNV